MMGIVGLVMGSYTAYAGWQSRLSKDGDVVAKNRADHRKLAPWLFFIYRSRLHWRYFIPSHAETSHPRKQPFLDRIGRDRFISFQWIIVPN